MGQFRYLSYHYMRYRCLSIIFLSLFIWPACFGAVDSRGSVKGFAHGLVQTEGGAFRVGKLSDSWKRESFGYKAIMFKHKERDASVSVSSFCKGSFDDAALSLLSDQALYGVTNQKNIRRTSIRLADREALRSVTNGRLDGVDLTIDTVTLKMNECVFDFVYVSKPDEYGLDKADFEKFYGGFQYVKGPR